MLKRRHLLNKKNLKKTELDRTLTLIKAKIEAILRRSSQLHPDLKPAWSGGCALSSTSRTLLHTSFAKSLYRMGKIDIGR